MPGTCYAKIARGEEVRSNLIHLRELVKEESARRALAVCMNGDFSVLTDLLKHEDPKVRKNAALLLGEMETEDVLPFLFDAWHREKTLFVRADYLKAMRKLDVSGYVRVLEARREQLASLAGSSEPEKLKHIRTERTQLDQLLDGCRKTVKKRFSSWEGADVILLTNSCQREITARQITTGARSLLRMGVRVRQGDPEEIGRIRTYTELLFPVPGGKIAAGSEEEIGRQLARVDLPSMLDGMHETGRNTGEAVYRYRLDIRPALTGREAGRTVRRICAALDENSRGRMRNSAQDYECEIRLLRTKEGDMVPLLKVCTMPDHRFDYRREVIASSIAPTNAALAMQIAAPYLTQGARVLDPFCGTGTMLIERNYFKTTGTAYGLDISAEAIEKARINADIARMPIHYIHRDFFDFRHEHLFDEIVTDMPRDIAPEQGGTRRLYERFLIRSRELLKSGAVLVIYTMEPELLESCLKDQEGYRLLKKAVLSEKNGASVVVLQTV